jgi:hypothetical protein
VGRREEHRIVGKRAETPGGGIVSTEGETEAQVGYRWLAQVTQVEGDCRAIPLIAKLVLSQALGCLFA